MTRAVLLAAAIVLVLGAAIAAADVGDQNAERDHWQRTIASARKNVVLAEQGLQEALADYSAMRHRRGMRGVEKQQVIDAVDNAKAVLTRAQEALDAATLAARRAGAPPGWFRERQSDAPASRPVN